MGEGKCGWAGCAGDFEAALDSRSYCRIHFYEIAAKNLAAYSSSLDLGEAVGLERNKILTFISEVIGGTTALVAKAKFLSQEQRDNYLQLTLSTGELYNRVQRDPRIRCNIPILIYRDTDSVEKQELTNTIDISKRGAASRRIGSGRLGKISGCKNQGTRARRAPGSLV